MLFGKLNGTGKVKSDRNRRNGDESMKLGMVGLPNVGKSTLFNALTNAGAESANYPFCTIEPNVGVVSVPDERLDYLAKLYNPKKFTPAVLEFVDIAGLVKGASKGEGLGNKFLSNIREVDAIVHVVRCFEDSNIVHVDGEIGPKRDIETINLELIFSDLEILERRLSKTVKAAKADKKLLGEVDFLERLMAHLEQGKSARSFPFTEEETEILKQVPLLSNKPIIYAANLCEADFTGGIETNSFYQQVLEIAREEQAAVLPICAKIEEEMAGMDADDKAMFLAELNLNESGLDRIIKEGYSLLGLISFLTSGSDEVRAWTITKGTKAPQAAGKIHTDFERGFIRAEIIGFDDLVACDGSMTAAKEKGLVRLEGKDYVMQDGDIVNFRFNV
jgi:GTP-binding protein YchF